MSTFVFLILCVQACLIENVYSQCYGKAGLVGPAVVGPAMPLAGPALGAPYAPLGYNAGCGAAYGGSGIGNVAVAGELPVAGTTVVAGQVPIIGAVGFGGEAIAAGAVSINGACGCGCGGPFMY